jgi:hypothetical protein
MCSSRLVSSVLTAWQWSPGAMSREGRTFLPTLGTVFREGDLVHLVVLATSAARLTALLGEGIG